VSDEPRRQRGGMPKRRARREAGESMTGAWKDDPSRYHRPDFEEGNWLALKHGARSARKVAPVAEEIVRRLPVVAPWTARPAFAGAVASYSWVEAQLVLLRVYVSEHGVLDSDGEPRGAANYMDKLERRASSLRVELGLGPQSLAKLLSSLTSVAVAGGDEDGLAALKAEGAKIVEARLLAVTEEDG
jgi:hypothetical protein